MTTPEHWPGCWFEHPDCEPPTEPELVVKAEPPSRKRRRMPGQQYVEEHRALAKEMRRLAAQARKDAERAEKAAAKAPQVIIGGAPPPRGVRRMFNEARQNEYLGHLFDGAWPSQAAKLTGVTMSDVAHARKVSPDFAEKERLADALRAERAAQKLLEMADTDPRAAIWIAEKFDPERFGKRDRLDVNVSGQIDHVADMAPRMAQIEMLRARLIERAAMRELPAAPDPDVIDVDPLD